MSGYAAGALGKQANSKKVPFSAKNRSRWDLDNKSSRRLNTRSHEPPV